MEESAVLMDSCLCEMFQICVNKKMATCFAEELEVQTACVCRK